MKSKRIFVVIGVFLVILCNSIVYGALNTEMFIDGDAYVRIDKNIRVTGIKVIEQTNGAYETYNCDYSKNTTSIQATLPSSDSSIVYEVTITNKGDVNYEVTNIDEESCSNSNIKYELIDLEKGTVINGKESYAFKIKLTNVGNNIDDKTVLVLKYTFECLQREWTFEYTGSEQEFKVPYDGEYKIELWGASGDNTGAYTAGVLNLDNYINKKLYVYVGEQRKVVYGVSYTNSGLTYNGGGEGDYFTASNYPYRARGGGGATDVRLVGGLWSDFNSLKSRIMVAGAGGSCFESSCSGGGLVGYTAADYNNGYGGAQLSGGSATSPATSGSFGKGGNGYISYRPTAWNNDGFGAGSGYFGGGGGYGGIPSGGTNRAGSGGGGSSYISGHAGSVAIEEESTEGSVIFRKDHNDVPCNSSNSSGYNSLGYNTDYICSLHYSGIYFMDTVMIDGEGYSWTTSKNDYVGMPSHDGNSIMKGNSGNGYAKITLMSKK